MPDTGAPWNIPYVENADLVRDWPADSLLVANAVAAGLSAAGNAGIGSNVVQTVKTDTFSMTGATLTAVTGLTVTITPTSASSKVFIVASITIGNDTNDFGGRVVLRRDSTDIAQPSGGAAPGTVTYGVGSTSNATNASIVFVDSPATASPVTYSIRVASYGGTTFVNRGGNADRTGISTITAIEVAA